MDIDDILADVTRAAAPREAADLQELTRLWVAERVAPEVLPYPEGLMESVLARVRAQIELVEEQTGNMDPKTNFRLILYQTELERFKFLVRSFLRARIAKIDKYPLHILATAPAGTLSASESQYLHAHQALLSSHYAASFLSQFPAQLQRLDDKAGGISMVDAPDLDAAVFCRVLRDVGVVSCGGVERDTMADMKRGDVFVVRWKVIREHVLAGDIELI
ncbi:uncharacterized protein K452DRAFT_262071 [Aplosporella prunicola CBS 121167]|uniref:DNA replication complex GINS protein SLD5 n=1 Tax=Aplosporella prunicola CBS 121167 TaxID=1176127 RepID=A0A6A6BVY9_9PEZI|nr:uncharacterized protein K452DRAFT_262071 [Aplosporella prunicola CBS 121167]KAF2147523.1 hypothetical protein K452DRAFT_262071 [Aplosporella prunicola CBS 121167]